jgi:hypothetical protein
LPPEDPAGTFTVTVAVFDVVPSIATEAGDIEQVAGEGGVQVRLTVWLNPPAGAKLISNVPVFPRPTLSVLAGGTTEKSAEPPPPVPPVPVPVSATVCTAALTVMVTVPVRAPATAGVKVIELLQFAPAAKIPVQVLDFCAKSPLATMLVIVTEVVPGFEIVMSCAALVVFTACAAKVRLVGDSVKALPLFVPAPESVTVCTELPTVTITVPARAPTAVGVNVTDAVQLALTPNVVQPLFEIAKSPLATILLTVARTVPVLLTVINWAELAVLRAWAANVRPLGVTVTVGLGKAEPVPPRFTFCGELPPLSKNWRLPAHPPSTVGVKVTETVQLVPAASAAGQLGVT